MKAEEILEKYIWIDELATYSIVEKENVRASDALKAMEEYAEQRIREELVKFCIYIDHYDTSISVAINEYLKQRKK